MVVPLEVFQSHFGVEEIYKAIDKLMSEKGLGMMVLITNYPEKEWYRKELLLY